jgi:hypothetical protein
MEGALQTDIVETVVTVQGSIAPGTLRESVIEMVQESFRSIPYELIIYNSPESSRKQGRAIKNK